MASFPLLLVCIPEGSGDFPMGMAANSVQGCRGAKWIVTEKEDMTQHLDLG